MEMSCACLHAKAYSIYSIGWHAPDIAAAGIIINVSKYESDSKQTPPWQQADIVLLLLRYLPHVNYWTGREIPVWVSLVPADLGLSLICQDPTKITLIRFRWFSEIFQVFLYEAFQKLWMICTLSSSSFFRHYKTARRFLYQLEII